APCADPRARSALQLRDRGVAGRHHSVSAHRPRRLALDDRTRRAAREIPVSESRRSISGERDARANGDADCCPRGVACKWLAQALDSGTRNLAHKICCCNTARQPCWVATQTIAPSLRFCPPYPKERTNGGHRGMSALSLGLGRTGRSTA